MAYDNAVQEYYGSPRQEQDESWEVVRNARPAGNMASGTRLEDAFQNAWILFTQFSEAQNIEELQVARYNAHLARGTAVICTKEVGLDTYLHCLAPISFGRLDEEITSEKLSAMQGSFGQPRKFRSLMDPLIIQTSNRPVLSLMHELDFEGIDKSRALGVESASIATHDEYGLSGEIPDADAHAKHY
ncbi:hypothetical protein AX16_000777 [Volvariella volvacea WC 439]|nr:hypothetical protein AX16_000777 [Volvariella volvacea WC 439]